MNDSYDEEEQPKLACLDCEKGLKTKLSDTETVLTCPIMTELFTAKKQLDDLKDLEQLEKLEQLRELLPVRPGDVVYETDGIRVYRRTVRRIVFDCGTFAFDEDAIANGNVFLTEREAEQAAGVFRKEDA